MGNWMTASRAAIGLGLLVLGACSIEQRPPRTLGATEDLESRRGLHEETPQGMPRIPSDSQIPPDPLGASVRRGRALLQHTRDSLPRYVGSSLRCLSCHLKEGKQLGALPLVGVYSRFPEYRSRNGLVNLIEDRINDCFERSLNGRALPRDGKDMRDIVAYLAFLSQGIAPPGKFPGLGVRPLDPLPADSVRGGGIYVETCARCHGAQGDGTPIAPPLWGPRSFNIGAGMARLRTAAGFIKDNMPLDQAGSLTDQQAFDVAAYVVSRPRPDFARKALDWPNGDPPPDVAYPTRSPRRR